MADTVAIPQHALERLKGLRNEGNPGGIFTSDFTVNEFLLVRKAGFEPVGLCVGSCIYHLGFQMAGWTASQEMTVLSQAMYEARELAMSRMRSEAADMGADAEIAGAEADAATAVKAARDDLARAALVHRRRAVDGRATLEAAYAAITPQVDKLAGYQRLLQERIEAFRLQKDTMKASYSAAQAQVKVTQSLTGTGNRLGQVDGAYRRAEDKMLGMRDKADAMDSLISQGLLEDPLDKRSRDQKEIAALRDSHAVEDELEMLKARLQVAGPPAAAALEGPVAKNGD